MAVSTSAETVCYFQVSYLHTIQLILLQKLPECLSVMGRDSAQDVNLHLKQMSLSRHSRTYPGESLEPAQIPTWQVPLAISQILKYLQLKLQISNLSHLCR